MKKAIYNILPATEEILRNMGEQIKLARLRRNLSTQLVAERAGISRATLWKIEKGEPPVAIGMYAAALHALNNLDKDLLLVAKDDELGRQLQDLNLITKKRASRRKKEEVTKQEALLAFNKLRQEAIVNGTVDMPLEEINKEISKVRKKRK